MLGRVDGDRAALVEQVGDRAGLAERATVLGEGVAHVGAGAVAVVGDGLDEHRHPARAVALVEHGLQGRCLALAAAGPLGDRPFDVVLGHRGFFGLADRQLERGIAVGVSPAVARGDRDGAGEFGELLTAAGVDDRLLVLDRGPLGVSGHGLTGYLRGPLARYAVLYPYAVSPVHRKDPSRPVPSRPDLARVPTRPAP